jgi:hypothetical protein
MTTLATPRETLDERVDRLLCSRGYSWPPLHSATMHNAISELIARADGLEEAIRAMALEIETLTADRNRLQAHTPD